MTSTDLFGGVTGHDVLGARTNARGSVVITKAHHFPRLTWLNRRPRDRQPKDRAAIWLRNAMLALAALAICAAVVSWTAQYLMVLSVKHTPAIAALEAGIPDAGAMIFASLGIALALHGKRAIRARVLNVAAVATSVAMNALAAGHGWRDLAIWIMPPLAYALASDTLIGVIRAWSIARQAALSEALSDDETTPLAILGGVLLWLLRLVLAPPSTLKGFRSWVIAEVRVAPGRTAGELAAAGEAKAIDPPRASGPKAQRTAPAPGKQAALISLAAARHDLAALPLTDVSGIATALAPEAEIHPSTARRVLLAHVRGLQNGGAAS